MLVLLFVVFIVILGIGIIISQKADWYPEVGVIISVLSAICAVGLLVTICIFAPKVAKENIFDEKIAMYEEENQKIEQEIDRIVQEYLKHEKDTYTDLKAEESPITLITLFPEIKADELVQRQIRIYVANREEIKKLKEEKIDLEIWKWVLYFK